MKKIYFIILAACSLIYVIIEVRKKHFSIQESFWWFIAAIVMLLLAIFPYSIDHIASWLNIAYPPSLLFVICIIFLLFINFKNSKKISEQQDKINELAQELSIIKTKGKNNDSKK